MDLSKIQHLLSASRLDGWLFTDFHGHDFISRDFLELTERKCTRRLFYYIPAKGEPIKLLSAIEPLLLDHLPGKKILYQGIRGQKDALRPFFPKADASPASTPPAAMSPPSVPWMPG